MTKNLPGSSFISGAVSAGLTTLCTYPCDIMRTRFVYQGENKMYSHILSGMYTNAKKEGFTGLYKVGERIRSPLCCIGQNTIFLSLHAHCSDTLFTHFILANFQSYLINLGFASLSF